MIEPQSRLLSHARVLAGVFVSALLSGCASLFFPQAASLRDARPENLPAQVELKEVPFFPQVEYQCGPAALATVLVHGQVKITPDDLVPQVYVPARQGSLQVEMLAAARRNGMVAYQLAPRFEDLLREIAAGTPVIVLQNLGAGPFDRWHYAVAMGYDLNENDLILRSGDKERLVLPTAIHEFVWKKSDYWAMVALPPDRIAATADDARWLAAVAALERAGNPRAARTAYAKALERWPDNVNASIGLANTYYASGELKEAEKVLKAALSRHPDSVVALNNLAQAISDQGRHKEALPLVERAASLGGPFANAVGETRALILKRLDGKR